MISMAHSRICPSYVPRNFKSPVLAPSNDPLKVRYLQFYPFFSSGSKLSYCKINWGLKVIRRHVTWRSFHGYDNGSSGRDGWVVTYRLAEPTLIHRVSGSKPPPDLSDKVWGENLPALCYSRLKKAQLPSRGVVKARGKTRFTLFD